MLEGLMKGLAPTEAPRCEWKVGHHLAAILVLAVCAVLGEAESFEAIALYGRCKEAWLRGFLALPNGIPSHDTFRRVLMLVDPEAFERCFLGWVRAAFRPGEDRPRQVAIDGKTVRRSFDLRKGRSPLHLVSAYATEGGIVLAQRATESKGGELAVLPGLLDGLDLAGCLVSLDALACQPGIAERIVGRGGDYLLALKGNRKKAHAEVKAWFAANAFALGAPLRPCFDAFDDGYGRLVRRRVFACADLAPFAAPADWPGLATVVAVETIRGIPGRGKVKAEIRHYLSSAKLPPEALAAAIRSHWRGGKGRHRGAAGRDPKPLAGGERAALGAGRHLPRGREPGAGAERGPQPGAPTQDRAEPGPGGRHAEGEPEGQAQVRRLGRRVHGRADRRLISCVTPAARPVRPRGAGPPRPGSGPATSFEALLRLRVGLGVDRAGLLPREVEPLEQPPDPGLAVAHPEAALGQLAQVAGAPGDAAVALQLRAPQDQGL